MSAAISAIGGVVNVEDNVTQARDEVSIEVDPQKAARIGLSTRQVGFQVGQYLIGRKVTSMTIEGETVDVVLAADPLAVNGIDKVERLVVSGPGGAAPLADLADVVLREGPVTISRTDGVRSATIVGDIVSEDTQAVSALVDETAASLSLPPGVRVVSGGVSSDIEEGFQAIFISMAVGIALVYLVMVGSLGSLRNPVVIVTTLPLALIGALVALAVTGRTLGLPAMMGMLLLIGIVVTNAVVLIAFVEQLRAKGMPVSEALVTGARVRLRPILMTALTTSFALLPLAVAAGGGGGLISAGARHGGHRRPDELHGPDPDRGADNLHAVQRQHPESVPKESRCGAGNRRLSGYEPVRPPRSGSNELRKNCRPEQREGPGVWGRRDFRRGRGLPEHCASPPEPGTRPLRPPRSGSNGLRKNCRPEQREGTEGLTRSPRPGARGDPAPTPSLSLRSARH